MRNQDFLELIGRFELPTSSLPTGIGVFCVVFFRDSSSHGGSNGLNAVGLFVIWAQINPLYPLLFQPGLQEDYTLQMRSACPSLAIVILGI